MATSPNFRKLLKSASNNEVIIPVLRNVLYDPDFRSFAIKMPDVKNREPDGWFHPSTHPLWPERLLYYYLACPKQMIKEPFDPASTMAVTQGHFWHSFIQKCLLDMGLLIADEVPVSDEETGSRGHMDGLLKDNEVFEFKTMARPKAAKILPGTPNDPVVLSSFRTLCPEYYMQGQEYMRLSGLKRWRLLILSLEYPFDMREIAMDYDHVTCHGLREKYLRVRQAVADQQPPMDCCGQPKSKIVKACPARAVCPTAAI